MQKYKIISVFFPEAACSQKCIYCNQHHITGIFSLPDEKEIYHKIDVQIDKFRQEGFAEFMIAFFGGSFTALPLEVQAKYLRIAYEYIQNGLVQYLKISTRPDCIDEQRLNLLKLYGVTHIELGIQSADEDVLIKSGRMYRLEQINKAAQLIKNNGLCLGMQIMIGLPEDTVEKTIETAQAIVRWGAKEVRIYPVLVLRDTPLCELYMLGKYKPLNLVQTIQWLAPVVRFFEERNIIILRIGLHWSASLMQSIVAGPWHPALGQLVYTKVWADILEKNIRYYSGKKLVCITSPEQFPSVIGHHGANRKQFPQIRFLSSRFLKRMQYEIFYCQ